MAVDFADWMMRRRSGWWLLLPACCLVFLLGPFAWAWLHGDPVNEMRFAILVGAFVGLPVALELRLIRVRKRIRRSREANLALLDERR